MMARHGMLWSFSRTAAGKISMMTIPWPQDEPLTFADTNGWVIKLVRGIGRRDIWFVTRYTFSPARIEQRAISLYLA